LEAVVRKTHIITLAFAVVFLFFIQLVGTLVESIYILDLLNTTLDEKALGLFFLFSPVVLLLFRGRIPSWTVWILFTLVLFSRGLMPYLETPLRMLASGIGAGTVLLLFALLLTSASKGLGRLTSGIYIAAGLALAVGLSVLLRTVNGSLDYSMTPAGSWAGWGLGILLGSLLPQFDWAAEPTAPVKRGRGTAAALGIMLILTLVYFLFSAPGVLARWTQGSYAFIVTAVSLLALGWVVFTNWHPAWFERVSSRGLAVWNLLFTLAMLVAILAHRVPFPLTPDSPAVVVASPVWFQQIPLVLTLLLFPVIFLDLQVFSGVILQAELSPPKLVPGLLLGSLGLVLLVFMNIFTNVWGYVEPVSPFFRNKFWLPFTLIGLSLTVLAGVSATKTASMDSDLQTQNETWWYLLVGGIFLVTTVGALLTDRAVPESGDRSSLVVMTYNIQQANDQFGSKSYDRQLDLIRQVSPDILALQESDSARISLNNNDYVRYFASKLGYFSYYGPKTVSGTYGTAILSKYPLQNPRSVFTYSDQDEIGTTEAEVEVAGRRFTIYNVHPAGSDSAMLAFAETLLARASQAENVIALGDYNLREDELAYQMIDQVFTNAWIAAYPSGISDEGLDMSGTKRIDHIFISPHLDVREPAYLLPPESATDHPAHWAEVYWTE
jgi:endonuclease/exonuclease/phosphatase family metal-dependent hydrolase